MGFFGKKKATLAYVVAPQPPAAPVQAQAPMPVFDDPDDVTRWEVIPLANSSIVAVMDKYDECVEKAGKTEKAYALGDAEFFNGIRQHEASRKAFHDHGIQSEGALRGLLVELQALTKRAQEHWQNLLFLLPQGDNDLARLADWCMLRGVDPDVRVRLISHAFVVWTNFGTTLRSFGLVMESSTGAADTFVELRGSRALRARTVDRARRCSRRRADATTTERRSW